MAFFNTGLAGLSVVGTKLSIIANNISIAGVAGAKGARAETGDVYAASALGVSSTAIGTGVSVNAVTQQFTNGQITNTGRSLDLAISDGVGFFILDDGGSSVYSRAGAFYVDRDGEISNSSLQKLVGALADNSGNITGARGKLLVSTTDLQPKPTHNLTLKANLDAAAKPPLTAFPLGFTPANPPPSNSYNGETSTEIFDSLGNKHIVNCYFVKAPAQNTWHVYIGLDGTDNTPTASTVPVGPFPSSYAAGQTAQPFTLVFNSSGDYVLNNTASPPQYFGAGPVISTTPGLQTSGTVAHLSVDNLVINGVKIPAARAIDDTFSTSDNISSAIASAIAINSLTSEHGVTATVLPNAFTLTAPVYGALAGNNLVINGQPIVGNPANQAALMGLINGQSGSTGVVATASGANITLTAADGRNIQLSTTGGVAAATFGNFSLAGGALDQTQRSTLSMTTQNNNGVTFSGQMPANIGIDPSDNTQRMGIVQGNSDVIVLNSWNPGGGATMPQPLAFDMSNCNQFSSPFVQQDFKQDGYQTGQISRLDVDRSGLLTASYNNNQSKILGQIELAKFANPQGLQPVGNTNWAQTASSGNAVIQKPGNSGLGVIQSGSLEDSNVDLTRELVSLLVEQRNFQANAQTIKASDAITQTIINL